MVLKSKSHEVIINGFKLNGDTYHSLAKYVLENINQGKTLNEIKSVLVQSGWDPSIIDFLYDVETQVDKSNLMSSSDISNNSSNSTAFVSKEEIEKIENQLKSTIKDFSKYEGKLESTEGKILNLGERLDVLKDSTSELRGMEMSSEKRISEFETILNKAESIISSFDPKVLETKFNKLEKEIDIQESNYMKFEERIKLVDNKLDEFLGFMSKIKSESSLLEIMSETKKSVEKIEDLKKDIDRKAGKIESIFLEFQDKLSDLEKVKRKSEGYDEMIKDLIKDVDSLSTKSKTFVTNDSLAEKLEDLSSSVESMKTIVFRNKKQK